MSSQRWTQSNTCVFNIGYHLIWCPKYRRKVLVGDVENRLKELLYEKAEEIGVSIASLEVMPDHVHLFAKTKPINAPHYVVQQFKGYTFGISSSLENAVPLDAFVLLRIRRAHLRKNSA